MNIKVATTAISSCSVFLGGGGGGESHHFNVMLHVQSAIFLATCLKILSQQMFSHCETSCLTAVILGIVSCDLPYFRVRWIDPSPE